MEGQVIIYSMRFEGRDEMFRREKRRGWVLQELLEEGCTVLVRPSSRYLQWSPDGHIHEVEVSVIGPVCRVTMKTCLQ